VTVAELFVKRAGGVPRVVLVHGAEYRQAS
jgi:hypothetical protein